MRSAAAIPDGLARSTAPSRIDVSAAGDQREWDGYVAARADATPYHRWHWRCVFERAFGHATEYLVAREDGAIVGVLPLVLFESAFFGRFGVSLPFVNHGGIVASHDDGARALVAHAERLARARGLRHLELRHSRRRFPDMPARQHKVAMLLTLPGTEAEAWAALDRKIRNQVRKAEKSGLTAHDGGAELQEDFYAVFARNMRDLGTPVYTRRFFGELLAQSPDETRIFVVRQEDTPVAAGITVASSGTLELPWASSLRSHRPLCANTLLYWSTLRYAIARGRLTFDFGRSTPGEGTYHFKRQWGAEPHPLCWEYWLAPGATLPDRTAQSPKFRVAVACWQRLPLGIATAVGPHVVRYFP